MTLGSAWSCDALGWTNLGEGSVTPCGRLPQMTLPLRKMQGGGILVMRQIRSCPGFCRAELYEQTLTSFLTGGHLHKPPHEGTPKVLPEAGARHASCRSCEADHSKPTDEAAPPGQCSRQCTLFSPWPTPAWFVAIGVSEASFERPDRRPLKSPTNLSDLSVKALTFGQREHTCALDVIARSRGR